MTAKAGRGVIVLGALSAIAQATARLYAAQGARIVLVGRRRERLAQVAGDLTSRGAADCHIYELDLATAPDPRASLEEMVAALGGAVDTLLLFYGVLGNQRTAEQNILEVRKLLSVNFTSAAEWCLAAADLFERQDGGVLVAISSVAGDRGRQSNYVYGAAKAGLTILMQGIAHRLARGRARAVVIKLGFVDTPMTEHLQKGGPFWSTPDMVARQIKAAADRGHKPVVYIPAFWRWMMLVIRSVPAIIFHKTSL
jgi:NAD(P)-dependent dehydrogenase (short-subunit alcohol dehydrogenase family)